MSHFKLSNIAARFNQTAEIIISDTTKRDTSSGCKDDKINVKQSNKKSKDSIRKKEEQDCQKKSKMMVEALWL